MKVAILVDIDSGSVNAFISGVEDLCNALAARLIHTEKSFYPIRIVPAENSKYPPNDTPRAHVRQGVNDASYVGHWRMGRRNRSLGCPSCGRCGNVSVARPASQFFQQCDRKECDVGSFGNAASDSDCSVDSADFRIRLHPEVRECASSSPLTVPSALLSYVLDSGAENLLPFGGM